MNITNNLLSPFESLPAEIIGNILDQLPQLTHHGIINKADIPYVLHYAANLTITCKMLAFKINQWVPTRIFLNSLSRRYGDSVECFTALWDNNATKTFQVIQDVRKLASNLIQEIRLPLLKISELPPDPFNGQTKQGFVLNTVSGLHLETPFGKIVLIEDNPEWYISDLAESFIERLNKIPSYEDSKLTTSESETAKEKANLKHYRLRRKNKDPLYGLRRENEDNIAPFLLSYLLPLWPISKSEIAKEKTNLNQYNIRRVNGMKVPDVVLYEDGEKKCWETLILQAWEVLKANQTNHDPLAKQVKSKPNEFHSSIPQFSSLAELPEWTINVLKKLNLQPLEHPFFKTGLKVKRLALPTNQAQLIEVFQQLAIRTFLDYKKVTRPVYFGTFELVKEGITWKPYATGDKYIDILIDELASTYDIIIKKISRNWIRVNLKDYPSVAQIKSEEGYTLFLKKYSMPTIRRISDKDYECSFMNYLLSVMELTSSAVCGRLWNGTVSGDVYLWIRNKDLEKTLKALNIDPNNDNKIPKD